MAIEEDVFREAANRSTSRKPAALRKRGGGGYAGVTFAFMKAIRHDRGDELVCTVRNGHAVDDIEGDAGVEIVCRVGRHGAEPMPVGPIPLAFRGLVQAVKAYETLTVQAAVEKRRELAVLALTNHPLVGDRHVAESLVAELSAAHGIRWEGR
jgi:6-phospho-beta-glucosidase